MTLTNSQEPDFYDILLLSYLYKYRALSLEMCWFTSYRSVCSDFSDCFKSRLLPLIQQGLIAYRPDVKYKYIALLTSKGQDLLRHSQNLPRYTEEQHRTLLKPSELLITESQIPHQVSLSDFLIRFSDEYRKRGYSEELLVFSETAVEKYDYMRPDGMLVLPTKKIFVEQDMGTESKFMLTSKWNRYRRYLSSIKNEMTSPITVPFIIDTNPGSFDTRCDVVRRTAISTFSHMLDRQIEVYIGNEEELLNTTLNITIKDHFNEETHRKSLFNYFSNEGYKVKDGNEIRNYTGDTLFDWFIQRTVNGKVVKRTTENGSVIPDMFVVDSYEGFPISVIAKAMFIERTQSRFRANYPQIKNLPYLITGGSLEKLRHDLESVGFENNGFVFYREGDEIVLA